MTSQMATNCTHLYFHHSISKIVEEGREIICVSTPPVDLQDRLYARAFHTAERVAPRGVHRGEFARKIPSMIHNVIKKSPEGKPMGVDCYSLQPNDSATTGKVLL